MTSKPSTNLLAVIIFFTAEWTIKPPAIAINPKYTGAADIELPLPVQLTLKYSNDEV